MLLDLTDQGHRIVRQVALRRRTEIARVVEAMPAGQRVAMIGALRAFAEAAGEPEPPVGAPGW